MKTQEVVSSFMADCKLRGLASKTRKTYGCHSTQLISLSHDFPPKPEIIQVFLSQVKGGQYNADAYYRTFRRVDNYSHNRFGTPNFMHLVTRPKIQREILPTISPTDLNLIAWALEDASPRDKAIICLFVDSAIREGECANLMRKDVYEDRIIVRGKTGPRVAPISKVTYDLLMALPSHPDGYMFHGTNRGASSSRLKEGGLYLIVKGYQRKAGYSHDKQFGPQTLRRSFVPLLIKSGGNIVDGSRMLGHKRISTTFDYYLPYQQEEVIAEHHKHTPARVFEATSSQEGGNHAENIS